MFTRSLGPGQLSMWLTSPLSIRSANEQVVSVSSRRDTPMSPRALAAREQGSTGPACAASSAMWSSMSDGYPLDGGGPGLAGTY
jgi:hypothetical protein